MTVILAYFHRYGWIAAMLIAVLITRSKYAIGIALALYGIWTLLGYLLKRRYIYCSFQNAYHERMTPEHIDWKFIRKSDVYTIALCCILLGIAIIIALYCEA